MPNNLCYNFDMRIAIFTDLYAPWAIGGIVSSIKAQKAELEKRGHEVVVFCPGFGSREKNVFTVPSHKKLRVNGAVIAKRPSVVEKFVLEKFPNFADFDLVHVHYEASCSIAGVRLAQKFDVPLVQTMHGREDMAIAMNVPHPMKYLTASILGALHKSCLTHTIRVKRDKFQAPTLTRAKMWQLVVNQAECADAVIAPSEHFARKLEHYGVTKPVIVVSNGIQKEFIESKPQKRRLKDGDVLKMIWNSRVSKEKRIMPFLQALSLLERPYVLCVYGDGNALEKAKKYAKVNKLKVKFYGPVKRQKIIDRMHESHLGIMASYNFDTQGMTLLEAEATGLPVFFCDPAMIEVVPQGSYILASGPEPAAMAIALESFAPEKISEMSEQMLSHRKETMQSAQIMKLLAVYRLAKLKQCKVKNTERN